MTAQGIDQLCPLPHQQIAGAKEHRLGLLFFGLHRHKAHRGPRGRLSDRFGIGSVVLLATHKRLHVNRRNEPDLVPQQLNGSTPPVRRRTRLHCHYRAGLLSQQTEQLAPRHSLAKRCSPVAGHTVKLEYSLCQVDSNDRSLLHGCLLLWLVMQPSPAWHTSMPSGGGIHPIMTLRNRCETKPLIKRTSG